MPARRRQRTRKDPLHERVMGEEFYDRLNRSVYQATRKPNWIRELARVIDQSVSEVGRKQMMARCRAAGELFASVPVGETCAWCIMQASRGPIFTNPNIRWHPDCDCQIIPARLVPKSFFDLMDRVYRDAKRAAGEKEETTAVLKEMRRQHPDLFSDGVFPKPPQILDGKGINWPLELPPVTREQWFHILNNHAYYSRFPKKTKFPDDWSDEKIGQAVYETISDGKRGPVKPGEKIYREWNEEKRIYSHVFEGKKMIVVTKWNSDTHQWYVATAHTVRCRLWSSQRGRIWRRRWLTLVVNLTPRPARASMRSGAGLIGILPHSRRWRVPSVPGGHFRAN